MEGLRSRPVPLPSPAQGTKGGKTTDNFQVQNSIVWITIPLAGLFSFLTGTSPRIWRVTWEWKKTFYCFKNGKQLLLSQSFIVSSSKTLHKSCKGWTQEQQNNKRNTNDQSRLSTTHWALLAHLKPTKKAVNWYRFRIIFQPKLQNTTKTDATKRRVVFNRKYVHRAVDVPLSHSYVGDHILLG